VQQGASINMELLEVSCLLHDIMRTEPDHARRAAELLLEKGYPRAAIIVSKHMDIDFPITDVGEIEILYLADKMCRHGRVVSIDKTKQDMESKFSSDPKALAAAYARLSNAQTILDLLQNQYGICTVNLL